DSSCTSSTVTSDEVISEEADDGVGGSGSERAISTRSNSQSSFAGYDSNRDDESIADPYTYTDQRHLEGDELINVEDDSMLTVQEISWDIYIAGIYTNNLTPPTLDSSIPRRDPSPPYPTCVLRGLATIHYPMHHLVRRIPRATMVARSGATWTGSLMLLGALMEWCITESPITTELEMEKKPRGVSKGHGARIAELISSVAGTLKRLLLWSLALTSGVLFCGFYTSLDRDDPFILLMVAFAAFSIPPTIATMTQRLYRVVLVASRFRQTAINNGTSNCHVCLSHAMERRGRAPNLCVRDPSSPSVPLEPKNELAQGDSIVRSENNDQETLYGIFSFESSCKNHIASYAIHLCPLVPTILHEPPQLHTITERYPQPHYGFLCEYQVEQRLTDMELLQHQESIEIPSLVTFVLADQGDV
ncbi:9421_t:CDS:2, partial [Acaulospora colombiana]